MWDSYLWRISPIRFLTNTFVLKQTYMWNLYISHTFERKKHFEIIKYYVNMIEEKSTIHIINIYNFKGITGEIRVFIVVLKIIASINKNVKVCNSNIVLLSNEITKIMIKIIVIECLIFLDTLHESFTIRDNIL